MEHNNELFRNQLLELLNEDPAVIDRIISIVKEDGSKNNLPYYEKELAEAKRQYETQYLKLQKENEVLREEKNRVELNCSKLESIELEYDSLKQKYDNLLLIIRKMTERYKEIDRQYDNYKKLSSDIHEQLQRVLNPTEEPCESVVQFLAFGFQENSIIALWEIIASQYEQYEKNGTLEIMVQLFLFFISEFGKVTYKSFNIYIPDIGERFDDRYSFRTTDSQAIGSVDRVILPGFSIGKNVFKKALVRVK